jgi:hypothetical protein
LASQLIEYAENLIEKGLQVTPVIDKRPMLKDWVNIGDEVLSEKTTWQKANGIGLVMGKTSGVVCLDIDILDSTERLKEIRIELEAMLPPIYCGLLGNPKKPTARLFKYNGERSEKFKYIDAELLADGNQKVIPPSIHPDTGKPYTWVGHDLYDVDPDDCRSCQKIFWITCATATQSLGTHPTEQIRKLYLLVRPGGASMASTI